MYIYPVNNTQNPTFGKFIKVKGSTHKLQNLKNELLHISNRPITLLNKKNKSKSILYIISGKEEESFVDLVSKVPDFRDLRKNPEAFLKKSPKVMDVEEAFKKLKEDINIFG